jgi:hypothetical protein
MLLAAERKLENGKLRALRLPEKPLREFFKTLRARSQNSALTES